MLCSFKNVRTEPLIYKEINPRVIRRAHVMLLQIAALKCTHLTHSPCVWNCRRRNLLTSSKIAPNFFHDLNQSSLDMQYTHARSVETQWLLYVPPLWNFQTPVSSQSSLFKCFVRILQGNLRIPLNWVKRLVAMFMIIWSLDFVVHNIGQNTPFRGPNLFPSSDMKMLGSTYECVSGIFAIHIMVYVTII